MLWRQVFWSSFISLKISPFHFLTAFIFLLTNERLHICLLLCVSRSSKMHGWLWVTNTEWLLCHFGHFSCGASLNNHCGDYNYASCSMTLSGNVTTFFFLLFYLCLLSTNISWECLFLFLAQTKAEPRVLWNPLPPTRVTQRPGISVI